MNAGDVGAWNANWAWSLPLIVLNVVIHVVGLGLINESVVRVLSAATEDRRFMPTFVVGMGVAALLATVLHGIEAATWGGGEFSGGSRFFLQAEQKELFVRLAPRSQN
jgi:hypothetical protein